MYTFLAVFLVLWVLYYLSRVPLGISEWVEKRLPVGAFLYEHLAKYPAPKNLNMWYAFGALAIVSALVQYVSGIWLVCLLYTSPSPRDATLSRMPSSA